jgi:cyanophycinase
VARGRLRWGQTRGQLVVIGGAESHGAGGEAVLARFVELAGGAKARIGVIATASREPEHLEEEYVQAFIRHGAAHVDALRVHTRADANDDATAAAVETCTGVFFPDGEKARIATVVGGSRLDSVLHARFARSELVLAGASAGAAMMSGTTIMDGEELGVPTSRVRTGPGMEFLSGMVIDMHFAARGRLDRLLSAIALYPHELGVGIDQDTAIVVSGGRFEVIGSGSVTVVDAGRAAMIRTPAETEGPIALSGVRLHVLPAGYSFELTGRRPVVVDAPENTEDWGAAD